MTKLTKAQLVLLADMDGGHKIERHFDVYGPKPDGHWWQYCGGAPVNRRSAERLIESGNADLSAEVRPYAGHRIATLSINDFGRSALAQAQNKDGRS